MTDHDNPDLKEEQPPWPVATVDEIVATNLLNYRQQIFEDGRPLSRTKLAQRLSTLTGEDWSEWRIIDLEGARSKKKRPRPAKWSELVALAIALDVTVFELVLPTDGDVLVEFGSLQVEHPPAADGDEQAVHQRQHAKTARELSEVLFRIPHEHLSGETIKRASAKTGYIPEEEQMEAARAALAELLSDLDRRYDELTASTVTFDELKQDGEQHKALRDEVRKRSKAKVRELVRRHEEVSAESPPEDRPTESEDHKDLRLNRAAGVLRSDHEEPRSDDSTRLDEIHNLLESIYQEVKKDAGDAPANEETN